MHAIRDALALVMVLALAACSGMRMNVKPAGRPDAALQHVVLVQLDDPALAAEMIRDMSSAFEGIPQVRSWQVGPRIDMGRAGAPD